MAHVPWVAFEDLRRHVVLCGHKLDLVASSTETAVFCLLFGGVHFERMIPTETHQACLRKEYAAEGRLAQDRAQQEWELCSMLLANKSFVELTDLREGSDRPEESMRIVCRADGPPRGVGQALAIRYLVACEQGPLYPRSRNGIPCRWLQDDGCLLAWLGTASLAFWACWGAEWYRLPVLPKTESVDESRCRVGYDPTTSIRMSCIVLLPANCSFLATVFRKRCCFSSLVC